MNGYFKRKKKNEFADKTDTVAKKKNGDSESLLISAENNYVTNQLYYERDNQNTAK